MSIGLQFTLAVIVCCIAGCFITWLCEYWAPKKGLEERYGKGNPRVKKYLVWGGHVISKNDKQMHYVPGHKVASLYKVPPSECIIIDGFDAGSIHRVSQLRRTRPDLIVLYPRDDGNYDLEDEIDAMRRGTNY